MTLTTGGYPGRLAGMLDKIEIDAVLARGFTIATRSTTACSARSNLGLRIRRKGQQGCA
jgi:hypothetical protein